jgi:hypothetical protein
MSRLKLVRTKRAEDDVAGGVENKGGNVVQFVAPSKPKTLEDYGFEAPAKSEGRRTRPLGPRMVQTTLKLSVWRHVAKLTHPEERRHVRLRRPLAGRVIPRGTSTPFFKHGGAGHLLDALSRVGSFPPRVPPPASLPFHPPTLCRCPCLSLCPSGLWSHSAWRGGGGGKK